ncbi:MAG TPA: hypothetical protein VGY96_07825 [Streptosporangiaceae bacterium]|jgi:hypothetical protein|nr:hypothetical protein [Streptosporangiaceae bacterium]
MWGRRKRRRTRLSRQLALGLLQDAMGQVEEQQHEPGEGAGSGQAPAPPQAEQPPLVPRQPGSSSSPDDAHTTQT